MDIKQLITFITLSQEKNYIKTSEKLNYAPSTLAKHIHSLEAELNTALVEFRNGKIELTLDGKRFIRYADEMLNVYTKLQNEFDRSRSIGSIRVAGGELMVGFAFGGFFPILKRRISRSDCRSMRSAAPGYRNGWIRMKWISALFR